MENIIENAKKVLQGKFEDQKRNSYSPSLKMSSGLKTLKLGFSSLRTAFKEYSAGLKKEMETAGFQKVSVVNYIEPSFSWKNGEAHVLLRITLKFSKGDKQESDIPHSVAMMATKTFFSSGYLEIEFEFNLDE